jgi:hypothetical protein
MKTKPNLLLWRVEWVHRNGYPAPYQFVWSEKPANPKDQRQWDAMMKEVHKRAKMGSRLGDFSKSWSYRLVRIRKEDESFL